MFDNYLFPDSYIYLPDDIPSHDWTNGVSSFYNPKESPSYMKKRPQDMNCTLKVPIEDLNPFLKELLED